MYLTLWYLVFGKLIIFWFRTMLIIVPWVIKFNLKSLLSAWIFARFLSQTICLVSHNADHSAVGHKSQFKVVKVHIFWEGHTILRNLGQLFDWQYIGQKIGGDFAKFCGLLKIYELYFLLGFLQDFCHRL